MSSNNTSKRPRSRLPPPPPNQPTSPTTLQTRLLDLQDDASKPDEELDLEASLFGKKRKRARSARHDKKKGEGLDGVEGETGMPGVFWDDPVGGGGDGETDEMFFVDAPIAQDAASDDDDDEDDDNDKDEDDQQDSEDDLDLEQDSNPISPQDPSSPGPSWLHPITSPSSLRKTTTKKPLWSDPSDGQISLDLTTAPARLRKLARGPTTTSSAGESSMIDGQGLESKLREQFRRIHPEPEWAVQSKSTRSHSKSRTHPSSSGSGSNSNSLDPLQALFSTTASFLATPTSKGPLPKGTLEVRRLRDANYQNRVVWEGGNAKKKIKGSSVGEGGKASTTTTTYVDTGMVDVRFHPKVGVLAAVGADRRLRLFNIDGHTNTSLLSLHIPSLPIKTMQFHPSGSSILLTGSRPFYYTYDLRSQRCIRSSKTLLSNSSSSDPGSTYSMEKTCFSPDGSVLAIAGRRGIVTLLAWGPGGSGQLLTTLKSGRTGGVQDMMWRNQGKELWVLGEGSEVDVWDLGERRCIARWKDHGGFGGKLLRGSKGGEYCAVASSTGVVNVYDANDLSASINRSILHAGDTFAATSPKPIRELLNLTTEITHMTFNHDAQMMAISSSKKKDAFRMFHLPSATAFTNWPTSSTPLGVVTCSDFSAGSEYVAMGNTRGKILLYSVEHYKPLLA